LVESESALNVAVVTGGHSYDVIGFRKLFRSLEGLDCYVQHTDDFGSSAEDLRDAYDAVVFYSMMMEEPVDEGLPWYAGTPRAALARLSTTGQGVVLLHHAIVAYPGWDYWRALAGIGEFSNEYYFDQNVPVHVADADHPITRGLADWEMVDETYDMAEPGPGCRVLLTTDHPRSMAALAWIHEHGAARVFCLQCGHDNRAWAHESFRTVLRRGILWAARRIREGLLRGPREGRI
jgi:type 1 glutamine amidotransferase